MMRTDRRPLALRPASRRLATIVGVVVGVATWTGLATPAAHADDNGDRGRVVTLEVNTPGSEQHASFHGAITVRQSNGATKRYHWGGSTCPGQKLDASQVALLAQAHFNRAKTWVKPTFVPSEGGDKFCLVAFELAA